MIGMKATILKWYQQILRIINSKLNIEIIIINKLLTTYINNYIILNKMKGNKNDNNTPDFHDQNETNE